MTDEERLERNQLQYTIQEEFEYQNYMLNYKIDKLQKSLEWQNFWLFIISIPSIASIIFFLLKGMIILEIIQELERLFN